MKKTLAALLCLGACLATTPALASFYEAYTAPGGTGQFVAEGQTFDFGFDLWYDNEPPVGTDSSLTLTSDASGAFGTWNWGKIYVDIYSNDADKEKARIELTVWDMFGDDSDTFNLGVFQFNPTVADGYMYYFVYDLQPQQLDLFDNEGWGNIGIKAVVWGSVDNDFEIRRVAMEVGGAEVAPVPEPGTLLLVGAGLTGLTWARRRNKG